MSAEPKPNQDETREKNGSLARPTWIALCEWVEKRCGEALAGRDRLELARLCREDFAAFRPAFEADARADVAAQIGPVRAAIEAALEVYGDEPCRYDHHGLCQAHNLRRNADGKPECQVPMLRSALLVLS